MAGAAHGVPIVPGQLSLFLSREEIIRGVRRLGQEISRDYKGLDPLIVGVLTGAFVFVADLVRAIEIPVTVDFIDASSYKSTFSTGKVTVARRPDHDLQGRHVILVEDIVDTGRTATTITESLRKADPASLKLCSLLDKRARRATELQIDYVSFEVPDKFLVGYGLDLDDRFRNLPDIYAIDETRSRPG